jgi:hypothetical protein
MCIKAFRLFSNIFYLLFFKGGGEGEGNIGERNAYFTLLYIFLYSFSRKMHAMNV